MPNTNGVNAVGVWMVGCIIMVFSALTEYGILLYIMTYKLKLQGNNCVCLNDGNDDRIFVPMSTISSKNRNKRGTVFMTKEMIQKNNGVTDQKRFKTASIANAMKQENMMRKIDSVSLFLFPLVFFCFSVVYLVVFLK